MSSFYKVILCHLLLFVLLSGLVVWEDFIGYEWVFSHPFYDAKSWSISLNPKEPYSYSYEWFITYLSDKIRPLVYVLIIIINPRIILFGVNIIYLYLALEISLVVDYLLFFNQYPFRDSLVVIYALISITHVSTEALRLFNNLIPNIFKSNNQSDRYNN